MPYINVYYTGGVTIGHTRYTVRKLGVTGYAIYRERGRLIEPILTGFTPVAHGNTYDVYTIARKE